MRLSKIQISRVYITLLILFLSGAAVLTPARSSAQCATPANISSITYDTVFHDTLDYSSFLTATLAYNLPQFPISTNTLFAVSIKSYVTASATVDFINNKPTPIVNPTIQLFRSDGIFSTPANQSGHSVSAPVFAPTLAAGDSENVVLHNAVNNVNMLDDSLTAASGTLGDFVGGGTVPISYSSSSTPLLPAGSSISSATVTDSITFSVTYYFCTPPTLATDILTFTAVRENAQNALLSWTTSNEQAGRNYFIQVSTDGKSFTDSVKVPAQGAAGDAAYTYNFPLDPLATGTLYFRLRVVDPIGPNHYSQLAIINLGDAGVTGFSIYPNPPNSFINISLPGGNQNWDISLFAADGNLVQENYYPSTNLIHLNFNRKMLPGTYFVRAVNPQTSQHYTASFLITD